MKKTLVTLSMAVVTIFGFSAFAQQQDGNQKQCNKEKTEKCCKKGEKGDRSKGDRKMFNPFEGIQLNADQQAKIDALQQKCIAQRQEMKKGDKQNRDNKDNGLTREQRMQQRQQAKREHLNEVKAILTPDQYVVFLENIAVNTPQGHGKAVKMDKRGHKDNKGDKNGKMGDRRNGAKPERKQQNRG